jgi:hypothetical protein
VNITNLLGNTGPIPNVPALEVDGDALVAGNMIVTAGAYSMPSTVSGGVYNTSGFTNALASITGTNSGPIPVDEATIYTFTSGSGTFVVPAGAPVIVDYLVVGGGGAGGNWVGGGGGAGGLVYAKGVQLPVGSYSWTVGAGGAGVTGSNVSAGNGSISSLSNAAFGNVVALGGGAGGTFNDATASNAGSNGGSGGGGAQNGITLNLGGVAAIGQGNSGGSCASSAFSGGGGGGGAGGVGTSTTTTAGGAGGIGLVIPITGSNVYYAGGGGGAADGAAGTGGLGGGGAGRAALGAGVSGLANTGGGGGGATRNTTTFAGGAGGSGVIILRVYTNIGSRLLIGDGSGYSMALSAQSNAVTTDVMTVTDQGNVSIGLRNALFSIPIGTAFDSSSNFYVCDFLNHRIREITPAGIVTTIVGNGRTTSTTPGTGTGVSITNPFGIALDGSGNAYFTEYSGFVRRLVLSTGAVTAVGTTSGNTRSPLVIGSTIFVTQGTAGTIATMGVSGTPASNTLYPLFPAATYSPFSLAYDSGSNRIYLAASTYIMRLGPWGIGMVLPVTGAATTTTLTYTTTTPHGFAAGDLVSVQGVSAPATGVDLVAISGSGTIVTASVTTTNMLPGNTIVITGASPYNGTYSVLSVSPGSSFTFLSTITGTATLATPRGSWNKWNAGWYPITSVTTDTFTITAAGGVFSTSLPSSVASARISVASVFAGSNVLATTDGTGTAAGFNNVTGLCIDPSNAFLYASEYSGNVIRRISVPGAVVTTIAGTVGTAGYVDARGTAAVFNNPSHLTIDSSGSNLYISDQSGAKIRRLNIPTSNVTTYAGSDVAGFADGSVPTTTVVNNTLLVSSNVGINCNAPQFALDVTGAFNLYSNTIGPFAPITGASSNGSFAIGIAGGATQYAINALRGDTVIRSTANSLLLVGGNGGNSGLNYPGGICVSNSNVGINCNAPATALDVNGGVTIRNGYRPLFSNVSTNTLTITAGNFGTHYYLTSPYMSNITLPTLTSSTDSNGYWVFRNTTSYYINTLFFWPTINGTSPTAPTSNYIGIPPSNSLTLMLVNSGGSYGLYGSAYYFAVF